MNPNLFSSFVFIFSTALAFASAAYDPPMKPEQYPKMDCAPTSCGNVKNITYPFWVEKQQPSHCGFPAFKLRCNDQTPILRTSSADYLVREIFYENNSLALVNSAYVSNPCPVPHSNLSFSLTPFNVRSASRDLVFLFNCSPESNFYRVGCGANDTFACWGDELGSFVNCERVIMPVVDYSNGGNVTDYARILGGGFVVEWTAPDCAECRESNGQCGYNNLNDNFMCICPDRAHWRSCQPDKGSNTSRNTIIGVGAGGVGFLILGCVLVIFLYNRRKKQRQSSSSNLLSRNTSTKMSSKRDPELGDGNYRTHIFSYHELEEATNGFNASRELGDGGFGTVYKGKLKDGRTVAVKRLYENNYRRLEQFMNEVDILSLLRHPNLVTLYGFYEFVSNGTLADHLHGALASKGALLWPTRMSIAIETADALAYLHAIEPQIIHRDVKTNNILLDSNFHVKVADFGLSRLFPLDATHVSTAPQGTPGYVDPEYHQCYQLTDKSDVYSFGVVLVELISSKPAVDISRHRHEINLSNMAINKIQNCQIDQLVDPDLGYQTHTEIKGMINQVAELAFRCLQPDRDMRPCIKEVLEVLNGIEGGGHNGDKEVEVTQVQAKEESRLLKNVSPFSPDTVTERWSSESTTPNTSG
ncbi:LEAF RUST 10 DISEASE-RESISTANCE LOCUS RECEPTOR-LIKE PROTEIN KINASE-like 1.2 isoform X2 [Asparagus officinalis]|uniref:LEAF RUST 10 DISEASE-RESISTANCE LOCUS RECEPTOR-LIKE PROTEIN KINASE-like 1.2 isoform X2 n=1 Tax=Asparagus officinalis TaxID=4686 RepID=UPI00098E586E|nr:LEAF RUST 10 DISEASE-RESISTANCE LOCUS RECEPTOR-LIKE PROTEIN KINASE-like 1.2 isoform X2 [Asparagus officinalis]